MGRMDAGSGRQATWLYTQLVPHLGTFRSRRQKKKETREGVGKKVIKEN